MRASIGYVSTIKAENKERGQSQPTKPFNHEYGGTTFFQNIVIIHNLYKWADITSSLPLLGGETRVLSVM
jgi:hypothetical protein